MGSTVRIGRQRRLFAVSIVLGLSLAAGLVAAGTVAGAGPLSSFSTLASAGDETGTTPTDTMSTDTTGTDPTGTEPADTTPTDPTATDTAATDTTPTTPLPPSGPPTIRSDKADYGPGETVVLTGQNWAPSEVVHIRVNDDQGETWRRDVDVIADIHGLITDTFALPTSFVAVYSVTATGPISGTATTTFTDGNVKAKAAPTGVTFTLTKTIYSSSMSCGGSGSSSTITGVDSNGNTTGVGNTESVKLQAAATSDQGGAFINWTSSDPFTTLGGGAICVAGFTGGGSRDYFANYAAAPTNTAPTANNVSGSTSEDTPVAITMSGSDAQQCDLTFSIVSGPTNGVLGSVSNSSCTPGSPNIDTASVTYTPNLNFNGSDSFTYQVNDGTLDSNIATVSITVIAVDDPPVAVDDSATVNEDSGANTIDVLANDMDVDGGPKTVASVTQPAHGTVVNNGTDVSYQPAANYCNGGSPTDDFTYTLNGGSTTTVAVSVTCVDDPPVIAFTSGDTSANEGQTKTYVFSITDPDSSSFTYDSGYPTCGTGGTLVGTPTLGSSSGSFACSFPDGATIPSVAARIRDASSASNEITRAVTVANVDPVLTLTGDAAVNEGQTRTYSFTTSDPGDEVFALTAHSCGSGGSEVGSASFDPTTGAGSFQCSFPDGPASSSVSATVSDGDGGSDSDALAVTVANVDPVLALSGPDSANEGETKSYSYTFTDPGADSWAHTTSCGANGAKSDDVFIPATKSGSFKCTFTDGPNSTVSATVADEDGGSGSDSKNVTVDNLPPVLTITAPPYGQIYAVSNATVIFKGSFTDPGAGDTHTCSASWDDGTGSSPGVVVEPAGSSPGTCTATHTYTSAGVYTISMTVTDDEGASDTEQWLVVVYDPSGGFVTGGGWINSPAGAYRPNPSLTGRANFGFVSKYKKGATVPEGQTEFQFQTGDLNFHSESYQWLVVAGSKAQYKGTGTINGSGSYGFMLTAYDGSPDRFRIKITDGTNVVYDNKFGASDDIDSADPQAISGGSIVVHK